MLLSQLFSKSERAFPKDEEAVNAKYLIRGGFIRKMSSGVFTYLPLGLRVLEKINKIIREEMNAIGGEELLMPALVARDYWEKANRWDVEVVYKLKTQAGEEFGLGWTHEEVVASIAKHFIQSYKDLPRAVYQIQTKFRHEPRAKNGLLRGREFLMKDLYSFHASVEDLNDYYEEVRKAYARVFKRAGLTALVTEASGGAFTKEYTHEFQVPVSSGEDVIFYCGKCRYSQNKEVARMKEGDACPKCGGKVLSSNAIEVGNIFRLGTRFSDAFDLKFVDEHGAAQKVVMGSYGIGPSRVLATIVETSHDDRGIIWPKSVAPFGIHVISLGKSPSVKKAGKQLYGELTKRGVEAAWDDRDAPAGEKFADADLIGAPLRVVISEKTLAEKKVEVKFRDKISGKLVSSAQLIKQISK
jgi:prolyl-tRNA synthetase